MAEANTNQPENGVVGRLCADELEALESEVRAGRGDNHLKSLDERGRAQELVRDQYSGRYAFELLQNADDAMGRDGGKGRVRFVLTSQALLIANTGRPFGKAEVEAICGLGRSSKDPGTSIGYKGLGFKSVAEVTDEPQIISGIHRFFFSSSRLRAEVQKRVAQLEAKQKLPTYAFPWTLVDSELGDDVDIVRELAEGGYSTIIRLPLKRGVYRAEVKDNVRRTLSPRQLLFLRNVDEVEYLDPLDPQSNWAVRARRRRKKDNLIVDLTTNAQPERWLVFTRHSKVDQRLTRPLGPAWMKVQEVSFAVAVQLERKGPAPVPVADAMIHAYFPTEEATGLPFVVHGDFALELDRRRVARTREAVEYNEWLAKKIAILTGSVVAPKLAADCGVDPRVICALLSTQPARGDTGAHLRRACIAQLHVAKWLPRGDEKPCRPATVALLPRTVAGLPEVFDNLDLKRSKDLLAPSIQKHPDAVHALTALGCVPHWSTDRVTMHLRSPTIGNYSKFWRFILAWRQQAPELDKSLVEKPWLLCVDDKWRAPDSGPYLPRQRDVTWPEGIPLPVVVLPAGIEVKMRSALGLLGVKDFHWRELALGTLIPLLKDPQTDEAMRTRALLGLATYLQQIRAGDERVDAAVSDVLLRASRADGKETTLRPAKTLYLAPPFAADDKLLQIYGPFGRPEFLAEDPKMLQSVAGADLLRFLSWLGVASLPRIDAIVTRPLSVAGKPLDQHGHRKIGTLWTEWIRVHVSTSGKLSCHEAHPDPKLNKSYVLDRLPQLVESGSYERLGHLWTFLAAGWNDVYEDAMQSEFKCEHGWHRSARSWHVPSILAHGLQYLEWVPAVYRGCLVLRRPAQVWRNSDTQPARVLKEAALLPKELDTPQAWAMCHRIGVVDSAHLSVSDLVTFLKQLQAAFPAPVEEMPSDIRDSARWAIRQLNRGSAIGPWPDRGTIPLLAQMGDLHLFVPDPVVTNDPTLTRLFCGEFAFLDADKDQSALVERLGLVDLGKLLKPQTKVDLADEQTTAEVANTVWASFGPILALFRGTIPSKYKDATGRLKRLAVTPCKSLEITYTYKDVSKTTVSDALIVSTDEQAGRILRRVGTAYIAVDFDGAINVYEFGRQLAVYLEAPALADGFSILLGNPSDHRYLASQHVPSAAVREAWEDLGQQPVDEPDPLGEVTSELWSSAVATSLEPTVAPQDEAAIPTAAASISAKQGSPPPSETPVRRALPPVDHSKVNVRDGAPALVRQASHSPPQRLAAEPLPAVWTDFASRHVWTTELGERAEQVVLESERLRLQQLGKNPDLVQLISLINNSADHDIQSVDDDGQRRYIEVKGTVGTDENAPFDLSAAELRIAKRERSRYWIYRVIRVDTETPEIIRFQDPVQMWLDGKASLTVSAAKMGFGQQLPDL